MADLPVPNPSQQTELVSSALSVRTFEGPLPPPSALREYEDIFPGAAERILAMAYVSLMGQPWVGGLLGGMGLSSIAAAFITGRNQPSADDPAKKRKV